MSTNLPTYEQLGSLQALTENYAVEAKAARGRDGRGAIPGSMWETYSAFANTKGGWLLLGVKEDPEGLAVSGLERTHALRKEIWDTLQDPQKVSANLLVEDDVRVVDHDNKQILVMRVPPAPRENRPVYIDGNPLTGTYIRRHEGDYQVDRDRVKRMLAEAEQSARDSTVLDGYALDDLRDDSVKAFRNVFRSVNPDHPFLEGDDRELLRQVGGIKRDRSAGREGISVAGLLMFGKLHAIHDYFDHFLLDFQEREQESEDGPRWTDRICTDGSGPQNIYDFYRQVSRRLTSDLKVPFSLADGQRRIDDTDVHAALREALVNTLIHADYSATTTIQVIKFPSKFLFRNPGRLRVTKAQALKGGVTDCRNPNLSKMFQMIGAAEKAGSGVPKIMRAWRKKHWRQPNLEEDIEQDVTHLTLSTASLLPDEAVASLKERFGRNFDRLDKDERIILVTTHIEDATTHERLMEVIDDIHPRDLTLKLQKLVRDSFLRRLGSGRGSYYQIPAEPDAADDAEAQDEESSLFDLLPNSEAGASDSSDSSPDSESTSPDFNSSSSGLKDSSPDLADTSSGLEERSPDSSSPLEETDEWKQLREIATPIAEKGRVPQEEMKRTLLRLCADGFRTPDELATLLDRSKQYLRENYLGPMVKSGDLEPKFPERKTHQLQAYRTVEQTD